MTGADVLRSLAKGGTAPTPDELAGNWWPDLPGAVQLEASERFRRLSGGVVSAGLPEPTDPPGYGGALFTWWEWLWSGTPGKWATPDVAALVLTRAWLALEEADPKNCPGHPLEPLVRAWQAWRSNPRNAKIAVVGSGLTRRPYEVSDVFRTPWKDPERGTEGVAAVKIDGEPVAAIVRRFDFGRGLNPEEQRLARMARARHPGNSPLSHQLTLHGLKGYGSRHPLSLPVPLIAFGTVEPWGGHWLAEDVATLIELAHLGPELRFQSGELAYMLARTRDGGFRSPKERDRQRALNAVAASMFLIVWVWNPRDRLHWPVRLADIDTDPETEAVVIRPPAWARKRIAAKEGRYTLTGAQSALAQRARMRGDTGRSTVRRMVLGMEYWLARTPPIGGKGAAEALTPASGKTGPGRWYRLKTTEWLRIAGEIVPGGPMADATRAKAKRRREGLASAGYVVDANGEPIGGGENDPPRALDTVEVRYGHGCVYIRATKRFTAADTAARAGRWEEMGFGEYIGRPRVFGPANVE